MGIGKIIGYIAAVLGVVVIALGVVPALRTALKFIPASISNTVLMIIGLVIVVIGIIPIMKSGSSSQKSAEVPIYQGKEVVGFRRLGK